MSEALLSINGHDLYIEEAGPQKGPAVVLLHHGLGSIRAWRGQIPALAESGFRVLAYDRWGYGGSGMRPGLDLPNFTTDVYDLHELLEQQNIRQAALVGHSDGGTIALYYAAWQPQRVSCLVTIAAHIYVEPKMEPSILGIREAFETDARFRTGMRYAHGEKYEAVFHNWFDGWLQQNPQEWDMLPRLGKITCPTLVVQGEDDEHATPKHAQDIARAIPGAELWIIPGAKHMVPQENTDEFNGRILQFLEEHRVKIDNRIR